MSEFREGDRVIVIAGRYAGRHGRIALRHDSQYRLVAKLLQLAPGTVRVVLDRDDINGGWSGVMPLDDLCHEEMPNSEAAGDPDVLND